ncbi:MAG: DUF4395 domain-containing protein [Burkholderiaceae bacterium]
MMIRSFGETIDGLSIDGRPVKAGVFDEHEVRAAAGLTLVFGAVAFVFAYFAKQYLPIKLVTALFFVEFLLRVTAGLKFSPFGQLAKALTRGRPRHWVSAKPKRFAWSLGLLMSLAMTAITNAGIRGTLPLTICLICMTLMWLEAVLGLCLGCEIYAVLVRRGWLAKDEAFEICSSGACAVDAQQSPARRP